MSKNISDIERKHIEKECECEELKVRLRESQIEWRSKKHPWTTCPPGITLI